MAVTLEQLDELRELRKGLRDGVCAVEGFDYDTEPKVRVDVCALCGCEKPFRLVSEDRYGIPARFIQCPVCDLVWLSPRMTAEGYARFYQHAYRPLLTKFMGVPVDAQTIQHHQKRYAQHLADILQTVEWSKLLDIGGSTGIVARELMGDRSREATILDPSADELRFAIGFETICSTAEEWDPQGRTWDLVTMCQTIDHLLDPVSVLKKCREVCSGTFWVDIVDWRQWAGRMGFVERALKIDHSFNFTPRTGKRMVEAAGFHVTRTVEWTHGTRVGFLCQ